MMPMLGLELQKMVDAFALIFQLGSQFLQFMILYGISLVHKLRFYILTGMLLNPGLVSV